MQIEDFRYQFQNIVTFYTTLLTAIGPSKFLHSSWCFSTLRSNKKKEHPFFFLQGTHLKHF